MRQVIKNASPAWACVLLHFACCSQLVFGQTPAKQSPAEQVPADGLPDERPPAPAEAAKCIRVAEGLEIQLFAAEPLVEQPLSLSFDHRGRLWVLEYIQYPIPNGLKPTEVDQYLRTKYDRVPEPPRAAPKGTTASRSSKTPTATARPIRPSRSSGD